MKILITNDDGISALGIKLLVDWAKKLGEVTVVAPKVEQSGKSHGIELINPVEVKSSSLFDGVRAYSVDSTPADCVRYGILGLKEHYDLVLSGINRGANLGKDIVYSGTVGAIFEAAALGHMAIALSTFPDTLVEASAYLDDIYGFITENKLLDLNPIYNINIPAKADGIKITKQGRSYFADEFEHIGNDMYKQKGHYVEDEDSDNQELDAVAVINGKISITPMNNDRTNQEVYKHLSAQYK